MHTVEFTGVNSPMDAGELAICLAPGRFDGIVKQEARNHQAHVRLTYAGTHPSPLERYIALTAVAGTIGSTGAVVALNENARASVPIDDILPSQMKGDRQEYLRTLPIPHLYAGFVELNIAGQRGVWMRTYGCQHLRLPNLAMLAVDRSHHKRVFQIFSKALNQLLESQRRLEADATMQLGSDASVGFRAPTPAEFFLHDPTEVFVVEEVTRS
jgi:hypothetical protein